MRNIVYFDLETRLSAAQVGGWHETAKMGMSVGVTYSTKDAAYHSYNHLGFDYGVLQAFTLWDMAGGTVNCDICTELSAKLGHRLKLDSVAKVTLGGCSKTAEGTDALRWWAEYEQSRDPEKLLLIARYCCFDVKVTMEVYKFGAANGYVLYENKKGEVEKIPVDWAL